VTGKYGSGRVIVPPGGPLRPVVPVRDLRWHGRDDYVRVAESTCSAFEEKNAG
jgi:hypothetical protein